MQELESFLQRNDRRIEIRREKVNQARDIKEQDKKTEIESHQPGSGNKAQNLEIELGKLPKKRGLSQSATRLLYLFWERKTTIFCWIMFYQNSFRSRLKKILEQQQHENRIPVSMACVHFAVKNSWKTQLSFRAMWLENQPSRFYCWEVACHFMRIEKK